MNNLFITGNGTGVGKTIVSAIVVQALRVAYWKPIQAGDLNNSDSMTVAALVGEEVEILPEQYRLSESVSPHAAAKRDGVKIALSDLRMPETSKPLVIEGAGGVMVPINLQETFLDLIEKVNVEVIFVSRHYLGSINHTLLSLSALRERNITVRGVIFNGASNSDSEEAICTLGAVTQLPRLSSEDKITKEVVKNYAERLREIL